MGECPICQNDDEKPQWTMVCGHSAHVTCLCKAVGAGYLSCCMCRDPITRPAPLREMVRDYQRRHGRSYLDFSKQCDEPAVTSMADRLAAAMERLGDGASVEAASRASEWLAVRWGSLPWPVDIVTPACCEALFDELLLGTNVPAPEFADFLLAHDAFVGGSAALHLWMTSMARPPEERAPHLELPQFFDGAVEWSTAVPAVPGMRPNWDPGDINVFVPANRGSFGTAYAAFTNMLAAHGYRRVDDDVAGVFTAGKHPKRFKLTFVQDLNPHVIVSRFDISVCRVVLDPLAGFNWTAPDVMLSILRMEAHVREARSLFDFHGTRLSAREQRDARSRALRSNAADADVLERRVHLYKQRGFSVTCSILVERAL